MKSIHWGENVRQNRDVEEREPIKLKAINGKSHRNPLMGALTEDKSKKKRTPLARRQSIRMSRACWTGLKNQSCVVQVEEL